MRFATLLLFSSSLLFSDNLSSSLSSQGFTGLINTPNAQVIKEGDAVFHFNNQFDNHLRHYDYGQPSVSEENFILGIGFLSSLEFVGRLSEVDGWTEQGRAIGFEIRDLSVNAKYKLPYSHEYLPNVAFGAQDIGGAASFYTNYYAVLDKQIGIFRPSLGYGHSSDALVRAKRMDGLFGGVEAQVTDWLSVMAEHDGKENHAALRLSMPDDWFSSLKLQATVAQNLTEAQTSFAVNVVVPLFHDSKRSKYPLTEKKNTQPIAIDTLKIEKYREQTSTPLKPKGNHTNRTLKDIEQKLVGMGFENVQVGVYEKSIYIKAENSIFDHNELDALGVIMGSVLEKSRGYDHVIITLLKNNLQTLTVSGNIEDIQNYFNHPTMAHEKRLKENLRFSRTFNESKVAFIGKKQNSSFFIPRLELSPSLTTTIGTEVGLFDYLVGLRANAYTTLYDGLTLSAMYEIPLIHSHNFDEGYTYAVLYKEKLKSRLVNTMLHQTFHYDSLLNTTSVGQFQSDYYGVLNHTNLTTTSGEHGFNLKLGTFKNRKDDYAENRNVALGSYRYFYAPLDLFTEFTYGQFWNNDRGSMVQMKRFFGETSVALYVKDTVKTYAGFNVSVPLTFRKLQKASPWGQIKGKSDFSYGIRTVVRSPDNANYLKPGGAIVPKTDLELSNTYLNGDRLSASYVIEHLDRVREAYVTYGSKE